jgi:hypothetical protein
MSNLGEPAKLDELANVLAKSERNSKLKNQPVHNKLNEAD